jgi:hypothetical protein
MLKILLLAIALGLALVLQLVLLGDRPALHASSTLLSLDVRNAVEAAQREIHTLQVRAAEATSLTLTDGTDAMCTDTLAS